MHFVVVGAGAIGTLFGTKVWLGGGTRVTLVAREAHARAVNEDGIRITGAGRGDQRAAGAGLLAVTDIAQVVGAIDYLLVTVKSTDVESVLVQSDSIRDQVDCVFSLQNGIDQDERLMRVFGSERVIGGVTMEGAAMPGPGIVEHLLASTTYVGEFSGQPSIRVARLVDTLQKGSLRTEAIDDISTAKWTKFVQSCAASGVCGVTRSGYAPATQSVSGATLYIKLVLEGVNVMRAKGMEPGAYFTDAARVRDIADMPFDRAVAVVRGLATEMIEKGYTGSTSLARDLEGGKPSEVDALMGTMYRAGERLGIPMPNTQAVYLAIKAADEAARKVGRSSVPGR